MVCPQTYTLNEQCTLNEFQVVPENVYSELRSAMEDMLCMLLR